MGINSKIEWTHHTFNPWWGCTKVSGACAHCYAEPTANRFGTAWGARARRRFFDPKHWTEPERWNEAARRAGERHRVFCASMADVFEQLPEDHPDAEQMARERKFLFDLIDRTPDLDWLLLTKRPENIQRMWPHVFGVEYVAEAGAMNDWGMNHRQNVWLGCTVEDQANADSRIPELLKCRDLAPVLFLSCEPLLGPLDLRHVHCEGIVEIDCVAGTHGVHRPHRGAGPAVDWVIAGGESGPRARPSHPLWFRQLRDQCAATGVPFFFKQWGEFGPSPDAGLPETLPSYGPKYHHYFDDPPHKVWRFGKKAAGRALDGVESSDRPGMGLPDGHER